jgi:hypothetical protein
LNPTVCGGHANVSCKWEDDEAEVEDKCLEACEEEFDRLSDSDMEEVELCLECVEERLEFECDLDDYTDAIFDDCEDECEDDDVGKFMNEVVEEWEPADDMDCD